MAKEKPLYLVGVRHERKYLEEVLKVFPRQGQGKSVGLEIDEKFLEEFKRIRELQKKEKIPFNQAFIGHYTELCEALYRKLGGGYLKELEGLRANLEKEVKLNPDKFNQVRFWFEIFKALEARGFRVVPLDRRVHALQTMLAQAKALTASLGSTKRKSAVQLFNFISEPVFERQMIEKAPRADYWVVGGLHLSSLKKGLEEKGLNPKVLFRTKVYSHEINPFDAARREAYQKRRRERQARLAAIRKKKRK